MLDAGFTELSEVGALYPCMTRFPVIGKVLHDLSEALVRFRKGEVATLHPDRAVCWEGSGRHAGATEK